MNCRFSLTASARSGLAVLATVYAGYAQPLDLPEVAMITALQGDVSRVTAQGHQPIQAFTRLRRGELLALSKSRLRVLYLDSGRQEIWQGSGRLEVRETESRAFGLPSPEVRMLVSSLVKRIAKTPSPDDPGRVGTTRTRAMTSPAAIEKLESDYRRMRMEAAHGDLNPELYLLSALFEMRELDRVEQILGDLQRTRPNEPEVSVVVSLYRKALRNAREARVN